MWMNLKFLKLKPLFLTPECKFFFVLFDFSKNVRLTLSYGFFKNVISEIV